jgi:four helix bundle protein
MQDTSLAVQSYRDLIAWQKAMDLVTRVYTCTESFPKTEVYGLTSQLRRAAVSIPSNIAEGHARLSSGEFRQFLGHALGSLCELETQVLISERLGYIGPDQRAALLVQTAETGRIINGLLRRLPRGR